jgi:hypothetical protein
MPEHEVRGIRAVYDHEIDDPGERRRHVADWGVGEELFDHLPRRRFRPAESPRRDGHARPFEPREARIDGPEPARFEAREAATLEPRRPEPLEAREPARVAARATAPPEAHERATSDARAFAPPEAVDPSPIEVPLIDAPPPLEARRTVVIRGRGAEPAYVARRSRPPRTVSERLGPRPDRVAAWAVALGMLLILIAILTAHG